MATMLDVFTDGSGCDEKRGPWAGWGMVVVENSVIVHRDCGRCEGEGLDAEIWAVVEALKFVNIRPGTVWCDNESIAHRISGRVTRAESEYWPLLHHQLRVSRATVALYSKRDLATARFHWAAHNLATQGRKGARDHYLRALERQFCDEFGRYKPRQIWRASLRQSLNIPAVATHD